MRWSPVLVLIAPLFILGCSPDDKPEEKIAYVGFMNILAILEKTALWLRFCSEIISAILFTNG